MEMIYLMFSAIGRAGAEPPTEGVEEVVNFTLALIGKISGWMLLIGAAIMAIFIGVIGIKMMKASANNDVEERHKLGISLIWCIFGFVLLACAGPVALILSSSLG